jgi:hypothetical protein
MNMKRSIASFLVLGLAASALAFGPATQAASTYDGKLVKMEGLSTLYYVIDGKRFVFPNEKVFASWFVDFSGVVTLPAEEIYGLPLAGNVKYRPGVLLVKITTNPKVYAVSGDGKLRWVKTEAAAKKLYGENWSKLVDDVPDAFFTDYTEEAPIEEDGDFSTEQAISAGDSIEKSRGLHLGQLKQTKKASTVKCRAIPAIPGKKNSSGVTIPAVPARVCHLADNDDHQDDADIIAPVVSGAAVLVSDVSATISWTTNEAASGMVYFSANDFASTTSVNAVSSSTAHTASLTGLAASTTYKYYVKAVDASGNIATTTPASFTTVAAPAPADTVAPVISALQVLASTTLAVVSWTTNEAASSMVYYSADNFVNTLSKEANALVTSHELTLEGLLASTTYQYYVKSVDAANNSATTTTASFITLQ